MLKVQRASKKSLFFALTRPWQRETCAFVSYRPREATTLSRFEVSRDLLHIWSYSSDLCFVFLPPNSVQESSSSASFFFLICRSYHIPPKTCCSSLWQVSSSYDPCAFFFAIDEIPFAPFSAAAVKPSSPPPHHLFYSLKNHSAHLVYFVDYYSFFSVFTFASTLIDREPPIISHFPPSTPYPGWPDQISNPPWIHYCKLAPENKSFTPELIFSWRFISTGVELRGYILV